MPVVRLSMRLWAEYSRQVRGGKRLRRATAQRWQAQVDQLITDHLGLAEKIARQVWRRFTRAGQVGYTSRIDLGDMISCAHIGLVEAARRYDPSAGEFARFAYLRIRGSILERYRRNAYRDMQHESIDEAEHEIQEDRAQRTPGRAVGLAHARGLIQVLRDPGLLPDELANRSERARAAARAIAELPEDERVMVSRVLRGVSIAEAAAGFGRSATWGRAKLAAASTKIAAAAGGQRAA